MKRVFGLLPARCFHLSCILQFPFGWSEDRLTREAVYITRDITSETNIFILSDKKGDCGDLYTVNEVPHGNVSKVWYDSPTLKMQRRMTVYTPAGYDKGKDYPVLSLLHGAGGDEDAWTTLGTCTAYS